MRTIPLTRGMIALVDDKDFESLSQYSWYAHRGSKTFYAEGTIGSFNDRIKAAKAYDYAAKKLFGEFASLNFS